jgi:predicted transcriptional regulator YheO
MAVDHLLPETLKLSPISLKEAHPDLFSVLLHIADGLAELFGASCEVVIHDLSNPTRSVVHVSNGQVTNRKIGEGIRDMAMVLRSPRFKNDTLSNYISQTNDGRVIKCMTTVIRDAQGDIVGAFCLNLDLGRLQHARSVLDELTQGQPLESPEEETPIHDQDVFSILRHIIRQTISETGVPVQAMDREVKIRIVGFLEERKVFRIKGAVDYLAEQLGVSRYTIYNYLEEVRTRRS